MYNRKRDTICNALDIAGLKPYPPQGAYYVLANISQVPGKNGKERAMFLLQKTGVACVPGEAFFHNGEGKDMARFCFAKEDHILDEACRRIEKSREWCR